MTHSKTERDISKINKNVFFKEFTFSKNDFKALNSNQQLEFADNVVWLDDLFFIYQIKEREGNESGDISWFENKVLKKGVKQIKSTLKYLDTYPEIFIENERGHKLNIAEAKKSNRLRKIIIYTPNLDFPEEYRRRKFYESSEVGSIHLFHSEDYYWICKYLVTPTEVNEYLYFREEFCLTNKRAGNNLPEQYFLGHFLETLKVDHFNAKYINNLKSIDTNSVEFDISFLIENFSKNLTQNNRQEYYHIIKEISKLDRSELHEFKKRFVLAIEKCNDENFVSPYRIYVPRTDCGFVFIPLHWTKSGHWKNALQNLTLAHKYEQKAKKCIGVVVFRDKKQAKYFELFWAFIEYKWEYNENTEKLLNENYPFRKVVTKKIDNRYK